MRVAVRESREVPVWLVENLLRAGRLLVVVDGLSERSEETRRAFEPTRPGFPIAKFIATSRKLDEPGMNPVLEPLGIIGGMLADFVTGYLQESARIWTPACAFQTTRRSSSPAPVSVDCCAIVCDGLDGFYVGEPPGRSAVPNVQPPFTVSQICSIATFFFCFDLPQEEARRRCKGSSADAVLVATPN